jgi:hypothetical protein
MNKLTDAAKLPVADSEIETAFAIDYDDKTKVATLACRHTFKGGPCHYLVDVRLHGDVIQKGIRNSLLAHVSSHASRDEAFSAGRTDFRRRR